MTAAVCPLLLLPLLLLLLLQAPPALGVHRLTECPRHSLTLKVSEDLPAGSALFSWDPARLAIATNFRKHPSGVSSAALSLASSSARAFFGIDFAISAVPGKPQVALTVPLPARGSGKLRSHFQLNCSAVGGGPSSQFRLELRLVRLPLRLLLEPRRPRVSRWAPAGTTIATVSAFNFGRRVSPDSCTADAKTGRPLTVQQDGRITLAAPPLADEAEERQPPAEWTATVTCEWRGRRVSESVTVAPVRLWRRRFNWLRAAASDSGAALTGAGLQIRLAPLLLSQKGLRVRLTSSSHPDLVRLQPGTSPTDPAGSLQLDLPSDGQPLTATLEATDALGSSEISSLRLSSGLLPEAASDSNCNHEHARVAGWPPAPLLAAFGAAAVTAVGAAVLACACLRRHRRLRTAGVKPQFV